MVPELQCCFVVLEFIFIGGLLLFKRPAVELQFSNVPGPVFDLYPAKENVEELG